MAPAAVVVLVGAAASGKTTVRDELVRTGTVRPNVVSLDDEGAELRDRDLRAGRNPRPLQEYSAAAARRSDAAAQELLSSGEGYLADATHLRRRERVAHVRAAKEA